MVRRLQQDHGGISFKEALMLWEIMGWPLNADEDQWVLKDVGE
jgi:hypothetical protein